MSEEFIVPPYECGDGWKAIIDPLVEYCREKKINISQIKEKYGELRFYVGFHDLELEKLIEEANEKAIHTCMTCGEPGITRESPGGWIYVSCDDHTHE